MKETVNESEKINAEIWRLQQLKYEAERREELGRCWAIFKAVPTDLKGYSEEAFGMVARVYVLRAYKREDLRGKHLPDHEWIRLWHEADLKATVDELWEDAMGYISGGCGMSG